MFRLKKVPNGKLQIHSSRPSVAFEGPRHLILAKAASLGVDEDDLQVALEEMHKMQHDYAEFGALGKLILTGVSRAC